ncbi:hypothetical protein HMPREF9065_01889 [Aggregatibacter sp. oral taxon 458 str. W10330]|nr:hypothetical protein HMPREF9065_01889 [Aggregatibacter sp. oral taxon 458 str. W10330]
MIICWLKKYLQKLPHFSSFCAWFGRASRCTLRIIWIYTHSVWFL